MNDPCVAPNKRTTEWSLRLTDVIPFCMKIDVTFVTIERTFPAPYLNIIVYHERDGFFFRNTRSNHTCM